MKVMILAAGRGKRMMPLTATLPKPMLAVNGKPLIEYHIERVKRAGLKDIVINLAWQGDKIETYFGDGTKFGVSIQYSYEPESGLETAGGIIKAVPKLCTDNDKFIVINGDIFTDYDVHALTQLALQKGEAHIVLVENPPHNPEGDFTLGLPNQMQKYTFSGIGLYHKDFFCNYDAEFLALGPILKAGITEHMVSRELYLNQWFDIGTPQRLAEINELVRAEHVG
jgi:MurNAc alpha-1-phosphate uridylyltransferase